MSSNDHSPINRPTQPSTAGCLRFKASRVGNLPHDRHALSHAHKSSLFEPSDSLATPEWCGYRCHLPEGEWHNHAGGCDSLQACRLLRDELPI